MIRSLGRKAQFHICQPATKRKRNGSSVTRPVMIRSAVSFSTGWIAPAREARWASAEFTPINLAARVGRCARISGLGADRLVVAETLARLGDGRDRGAAGLGDLAVAAVGVALDLELDQGGGAQLGALVARHVLGGVVEGRLGGDRAAAEQAERAALVVDPAAGQLRGVEIREPAHVDLAALAGPGPGMAGTRPAGGARRLAA